MKMKNGLQNRIRMLTALFFTTGLVLSSAMSLRVSALQDGANPPDSQDTVVAEQTKQDTVAAEQTKQETVVTEQKQQDTVVAEQTKQDKPLGIQQDSLQAIQEKAASETTPEEKKNTSAEYPVYTAEDIACHGAKVLAGAKGLYSIRVNRAACTVTVYQTLVTGEQVPFKAFICSASEWTPTGQFSIQSKLRWSALAGGVYGQYCMPVTGPYWFHSVPYYSKSEDDLEYLEFNKLGQNVSLGCVRLKVEDVKWIYDNCDIGTPVEIYDDLDAPGPLGQPEPVRIDLNSPKRGWDPTDPNPKNPWTDQEVEEYNRLDKAPMNRENDL